MYDKSEFILFAVQNCPALTNISHAHLSTLQTEFSTMVTVTCNYGYQFVHGNEFAVSVECVDGGNWNASVSSCQGESNQLPRNNNGSTYMYLLYLYHACTLHTEIARALPQPAVNASLLSTDPVATRGRYQYLTNITYQCLPEMRLEDGHVVGNSTCVGVNS